MNDRIERRLLSLHRRVAPARLPEYGSLWSELAAVATEGGAHAWRFVSRADPELHLEFLEFEASKDPRVAEKARGLLARLDEEIGPARLEEWLEAR